MSKFTEMWNLREAYRRVFQRGEIRDDAGNLKPEVGSVLNSLREFCRVDKSCVQFTNGAVDTHLTCVIEGRRETWLELVRVLRVTDAELIAIREQDD